MKSLHFTYKSVWTLLLIAEFLFLSGFRLHPLYLVIDILMPSADPDTLDNVMLLPLWQSFGKWSFFYFIMAVPKCIRQGLNRLGLISLILKNLIGPHRVLTQD